MPHHDGTASDVEDDGCNDSESNYRQPPGGVVSG